MVQRLLSVVVLRIGLQKLDLLTMNNGIVRAAVEENPHGFSTAVVDFVLVDLDVVASLGSDDTCGSVNELSHRKGSRQ